MRWPTILTVGVLLLLAGFARSAAPAWAGGDQEDDATAAYLDWVIDVADVVQNAGLALDKLLARREDTEAWRGRVAEALGLWEGAYQDALGRRPPGPLAPAHSVLTQGLGDYALAADLIRLGVARDDDALVAEGLAHEQDGQALLDVALGMLQRGMGPAGPAD